MAAPALTHRPFAIQRWGEAFRLARMKLNHPLTVRELADRAGVGKKTVEAWEACDELPDSAQLKRLYTLIPPLRAREELWRNEKMATKPLERAPRPMPETKRPIAPVKTPSPPVVVTETHSLSKPTAAKIVYQEAGETEIAQLGVRYALAMKDVKSAERAVEKEKLACQEAIRAATARVAEIEKSLKEKRDAVVAAKSALDDAVANQ